MSGYTIIEADSMEVALEIAKACPFLDIGGSLGPIAKSPGELNLEKVLSCLLCGLQVSLLTVT